MFVLHSLQYNTTYYSGISPKGGSQHCCLTTHVHSHCNFCQKYCLLPASFMTDSVSEINDSLYAWHPCDCIVLLILKMSAIFRFVFYFDARIVQNRCCGCMSILASEGNWPLCLDLAISPSLVKIYSIWVGL